MGCVRGTRHCGLSSSLGPCHTQEALEMLGPSGASVSVPLWQCSSVAILGRREQLFSEQLLCAIPSLMFYSGPVRQEL